MHQRLPHQRPTTWSTSPEPKPGTTSRSLPPWASNRLPTHLNHARSSRRPPQDERPPLPPALAHGEAVRQPLLRHHLVVPRHTTTRRNITCVRSKGLPNTLKAHPPLYQCVRSKGLPHHPHVPPRITSQGPKRSDQCVRSKSPRLPDRQHSPQPPSVHNSGYLMSCAHRVGMATASQNEDGATPSIVLT
jgi:hypothetical protein